MKQLILKLILPLTLISFVGFTKWWYVLNPDETDFIVYGFPFIYTCPALHTSLASEYFILELLADILCYFSFWLIIIYSLNKKFPFKVKKAVSIIVWSIAILLSAFPIFWATFPENIFQLKRDFDVEVIETGYAPGWKYIERPIMKNIILKENNKSSM